MSTLTDKLVSTYFSDEANALKLRSSKAFKTSIVAGFGAVASFAVVGALIFLSVLQLNPMSSTTTILIGVFFAFVTLCLILTCWIFIGRSVYLRSQLAKHMNDEMAKTSV